MYRPKLIKADNVDDDNDDDDKDDESGEVDDDADFWQLQSKDFKTKARYETKGSIIKFISAYVNSNSLWFLII